MYNSLQLHFWRLLSEEKGGLWSGVLAWHSICLVALLRQFNVWSEQVSGSGACYTDLWEACVAHLPKPQHQTHIHTHTCTTIGGAWEQTVYVMTREVFGVFYLDIDRNKSSSNCTYKSSWLIYFLYCHTTIFSTRTKRKSIGNTAKPNKCPNLYKYWTPMFHMVLTNMPFPK